MAEIRPPLTPTEIQNILGISVKDRLQTAATIAAGICANSSLGFENGVDVQWIANAAIATTDKLITELNRTKQ